MCLPVFCEACRDKSGIYGKVTELLPVRVASYMLLPYTLPVQSAYSAAQRSVRPSRRPRSRGLLL